MKKTCAACQSPDIYTFYEVERIPVFLNRLFPNKEAAIHSRTASVALACCHRCGLVFNTRYQDALMDYDSTYQQSQGHSSSFIEYTHATLRLYTDAIDAKKDKVLEIGCGKEAYFLNLLRDKGINVYGCDPVYAGNDPHIAKSYFTAEMAQQTEADIVIMRLMLYLLEYPHNFLLMLKESLPSHAVVFFEVPRFEWIIEKNSFWDISHEVSNYFTEDFVQTLFGGKAVIHRTFSDQYMIVKARLSDLAPAFAEKPRVNKYANCFGDGIPVFKETLQKYKRNFVWGAGAKGNAFACILDAEAQQIEAVIDINKEKQSRFVPLSGHPCIAPEEVAWDTLGADSCLWIMNENYKAEIIASIPAYKKGRVVVLGEMLEAAEA